MKIIECPNYYDKKSYEVALFMGGGMSNLEWQDKFLNQLDKYNLNSLVIYNPYNPNITNIEDQIKWEYTYLNNYRNDYFIFTMYFDKYTKQPMSMYELGRASVLSKPILISIRRSDDPYCSDRLSYFAQKGFPVIVSFDEKAPLKNDIKAQLDLLDIKCDIRTPEEHAKQVLFWYNSIKGRI